MGAKKVVVVDETTGDVVSPPLTEKQADAYVANAVTSHTYVARPADDEVDPPDA